MREEPERTIPREPVERRSPAWRVLRKTAIGVVGGVVTAAGVVMLVTPGPGVVVTLAGLGILGREFPAIRERLQRLRAARGRRSEVERRGS